MDKRIRQPVNERAFLREVLELACKRPIVESDKFQDVKFNSDFLLPREPFRSLLNNRHTEEASGGAVVDEELAHRVDNLAIQSRVWTRSDLKPSSDIVQTFLPHEAYLRFPQTDSVNDSKKKKKKSRWRNRKCEASSSIDDGPSPATCAVASKQCESLPSATKINNDSKASSSAIETKVSPSKPANILTKSKKEGSGPNTKKSKKKSDVNEAPVEEEKFKNYESESVISAGLRDGTHIKGEIRINARNVKQAFVTDQDSADILIQGVVNRNRALDGDVVVVRLEDASKWITRGNEDAQKTGKVVDIAQKVHNRECIGTVQTAWRKGKLRKAVVMPVDQRLPRLRLEHMSDPILKELLADPNEEMNDWLIHCKLLDWGEDPSYASGALVEILGIRGNIEVETIAAFRTHGLDDRRLAKDILSPRELELMITTDEELSRRLDLRQECVFSIDPPTARDLDDALSIKKIWDDVYEVGVHISDVAHYIENGSCLDIEAARRATSIYLVDSVVHMLPVELCLHCSLLPGQDKLAFSVIWKMDSEGNILDTKIAKTIVNSCAQLSYAHAQAIIDGTEPNLPTIYNDFTSGDIKLAVEQLHSISRCMLKRRFEHGSLKINQPKTCVKLDENHKPVDVFIYELRESNSLIEEFMLQANQTVAEIIFSAYPTLALLRRHAPPKRSILDRMEPKWKKLGVHITANSSLEFNSSLLKIQSEDSDRALVLTNWCARTMKRAEYFCHEDYTHHYALCFDLYTHFTSPIRRYADVVVHRLLAAAIGYSPMPDWDTEAVNCYAETSNTKKYSAKKMGDDHIKLYVAEFIRLSGSVEAQGVIDQINKNGSLDVIVKKFGFMAHVNTGNIDAEVTYDEGDGLSSLTIAWKASPDVPVVLKVFSPVRLRLKVDKPNDFTISAQLIQ